MIDMLAPVIDQAIITTSRLILEEKFVIFVLHAMMSEWLNFACYVQIISAKFPQKLVYTYFISTRKTFNGYICSWLHNRTMLHFVVKYYV